MVAPWWPHGGPSEQGTVPLALDGGGGPDQPGLVGSVGRVAQGVDGLQASAPLQAATAVGEGVEGEAAVVLPQAAGSCNTQHGALLVTAPSEGHPEVISHPAAACSNLDGAPSPRDHLSHPMAPQHYQREALCVKRGSEDIYREVLLPNIISTQEGLSYRVSELGCQAEAFPIVLWHWGEEPKCHLLTALLSSPSVGSSSQGAPKDAGRWVLISISN